MGAPGVELPGADGKHENASRTTGELDHATASREIQPPVSRIPAGKPLDSADARQLTDAIRRDTRAIWAQLLRAYEGNVHGVLGYASWFSYCEAEFDFSKSKSYRLLQAARVIELIDDQLPMGDSPVETERIAREYVPLLGKPDVLREVHAEIAEAAPRDEAGQPKITANTVRKVVDSRRAPPPKARAVVTKPAAKWSDDLPQVRIGLNDAVKVLRDAINREPGAALGALEKLRSASERGLYGPGNDAAKAFSDLLAIVALLLERQS